ncbi:putative F-box/kelch-repeat protein At3g17570 [Ipomoea triloba]|uniref:putative F-box/kelch-repeat protein At3g17570 n=1 Tax=Ipomoea triloba TaxID=35885 RepID=UPI00125CDF9A|nr:putative F-box/kelch-repeat protein At3g17570 [Ipomoea triloba]
MENCKLPRELLIEILARLPVKSLMRFKSFCKFFYSLIKSDNHFQHKHYEISRVRRDYVIFQREIGIREFPLRDEVFGLVCKELDSDEIGCVDLVMPKLGKVKCIDGILCLIAHRTTDGTRNIWIWNPSTREIKALPPVSAPHNFFSDQMREVVGFGFCNNMTGKVIIFWSSYDGCVCKVMVCNQVDNLWGWREINQYPHFDSLWATSDYDIYLKGKYYWYLCAYPGDEIKQYLLWFDMSAESFGTISLPFNPPEQYGNGGKAFIRCMVSVMNDTIALIGYREQRSEVWLMIENDSDVNWHKYACFDNGNDYWQPMQIWNQDRHLLICRTGAEEDDREPHLVSIDLVTGEKKKRLNNIDTFSEKCFLAYSESLKMF